MGIGKGKVMNDKIFGSFYDLEVYRNTSEAAVIVIQKILPKLPREERFDLDSQLRRSAKEVPRLIAEAYSKRFQIKGYQSLLDDATEESNESMVSQSQVRDIYGIETEQCNRLIDLYDKSSRQLQKLGLAWSRFIPRKTKLDKPALSKPKSSLKPVNKENKPLANKATLLLPKPISKKLNPGVDIGIGKTGDKIPTDDG